MKKIFLFCHILLYTLMTFPSLGLEESLDVKRSTACANISYRRPIYVFWIHVVYYIEVVWVPNATKLLYKRLRCNNYLVDLLFWLADVFDKTLSSCCPTKYLHSCCPQPFTEPCNASVTAPSPGPSKGLGKQGWSKPFCMKPQNSTACEAGFYLDPFTKQVEPCPDGKVV